MVEKNVNSAFFELLETFDKTEVVRFGKFVRSPFVTHRAEMSLIFAEISKCFLQKKAFPDKVALFKAGFPDKNYDDLLLRATMSDLREMMEDFLVFQKIKKDKTAARLLLAEELRERNQSRLFHQNAQKIERFLAESPEKNADHLRRVFDLQIEKTQFQTRTVRTGELNLQEISDSLDRLFLAQKLRHACTQISHQAVFRIKYAFGLLPKVLDSVESDGHLAEPAVALYYYCYRFLTDPHSLIFFRKFRAELSQHGHFFPFSELKNLYLLALNFCIRQLNEGSEPFVREGWDLYREGLEGGFLLENGRLSGFTFNNVVAMGIKLKEFSAVEHFIETYAGRLEPAQKEPFTAFNLARIEWARRNFGNAMVLLQKADFRDLVNSLISKTLLLKIYFELGETDLLDSHIDSFRTFIRRNDVSDFHRTNYTNILRFAHKLAMLPPSGKKERVKLRAEIEQSEPLSEKDWLLEKLG